MLVCQETGFLWYDSLIAAHHYPVSSFYFKVEECLELDVREGVPLGCEDLVLLVVVLAAEDRNHGVDRAHPGNYSSLDYWGGPSGDSNPPHIQNISGVRPIGGSYREYFGEIPILYSG